MTTLYDMKRAYDTLTEAEQVELREYIEQQTLKREIETMLADEPPEKLQAGTMDMNQLQQAAEGMWAGLDEDEIEDIVGAMTGKPPHSGPSNA